MNDFPITYLITYGETTAENFFEKKPEILKLVRAAIESKISLIQIREKNLPARLVFNLAADAVKLTRNSRTKILINDRADIALAANADGVHLTASSISARIIRRNFPKKFIVGVSAHTIEEVEKAKAQGASFATFSPIFSAPGKGEPHGLETLREVCRKLKPFPVIALGGVDENNYKQILENGAGGFAAIRFLNNQGNLRKLSEDLR